MTKLILFTINQFNSTEFSKAQQLNGVETAQHINQSEAGFGDSNNNPSDIQPIIQMLCGLLQSLCANKDNEGPANIGEAQPLHHRDRDPLPVIGEIIA